MWYISVRRVSNHSQQWLLRGETLDLLCKSSHTEECPKYGHSSRWRWVPLGGGRSSCWRWVLLELGYGSYKKMILCKKMILWRLVWKISMM